MHSTPSTFAVSLFNNPQLNHTSWASKRATADTGHLRESVHNFWPREGRPDSENPSTRQDIYLWVYFPLKIYLSVVYIEGKQTSAWGFGGDRYNWSLATSWLGYTHAKRRSCSQPQYTISSAHMGFVAILKPFIFLDFNKDIFPVKIKVLKIWNWSCFHNLLSISD